MDAREELATKISRVWGYPRGIDSNARDLATELLAAGYRKMPDRKALEPAINGLDYWANYAVNPAIRFDCAVARDAILALMEGNK